MHTRSLRNALLAPLVGLLVLLPLIFSLQYFIQVRSLRVEYERHSHEVAMRVADLISFSYRHIAESYIDMLTAVTACHEAVFGDLPPSPEGVDVSNAVTRALAHLPSGVHLDVAVVSRKYRILDTTYREELGFDLSGFPDAVAAFSEAARTGEIVPEFPVVDSTGDHIRLYTHSVAPGGAYFVQLAACRESADTLFSQLKQRVGSSAAVGEVDVYLFNTLQREGVAHVFNLHGSGTSVETPSTAARVVSDLACDPAKTSAVISARSAMGFDYYQQVEVDPALAGALPFGAVVRVRLDSRAHRRFMASHMLAIAVAAVLVFVCIGIAAWSLNRTFYTPIRALAHHVQSAEPIGPDSPVHATQEFTWIASQFNEHLDRIRLSEAKLRELYEETEQLVCDRTVDLASANRRLSDSESELRFLSERLLSLQEEQMHRIALELHDEFGQCLVGMKLSLHALEREFKGRDDSERPVQIIDDCLAIVERVMRQVRSLVSLLRPEVLDAKGVEKAIQWLADQYQDSGPSIQTQVELVPWSVPQEFRIPIFRIAQEAINNAIKHSAADEVKVLLVEASDAGIELVIQDNGCGFEHAAGSRSGRTAHKFGLVSMRERAQHSGGTLSITTSPGQGTRIRAHWGGTAVHPQGGESAA